MRDAFLAYARPDQEFADGLAGSLAGRGLSLGEPVPLRPQGALLAQVDIGLTLARHAVVVISREFLHQGYSRRDLDLLAARDRAVCLLFGVDERDVGEFSAKLAVAALPGTMAELLVRLLRAPDAGANGRAHHP